MNRIDWRNHFVAFISTLLGIFIAFQLEDWRETRAEKERVKITFQSIKFEIEENLRIYQTNVTQIRDLLEYVDFILSHSTGDKLVMKTTDYNLYQAKYPDRFEYVKLIRNLNDSLSEYTGNLSVDFMPLTGISTSNWEAAKSTGVLTLAEPTKVADLTYIYEWTYKDLGFVDSDFFKFFISNDEKFTDLEQMISNYKRLADIYEYKLNKIDSKLKTISW
jgi:hypothetical protein